MQFKLFSGLVQLIKDTFNEIEIDIEVTPADSVSAEFQMEVEAGSYLYSFSLDRWFHTSEVTPIPSTWGENEAALTSHGFVLLAVDCVWDDGYAVSDMPLPVPPVSTLRQMLNAGLSKDTLAYEMGY